MTRELSWTGAYWNRIPPSGDRGLIICAYAVGATKGYFYIRAEYPLAIQRIKHALDQAREKGLLGGDCILGSGFNFDIEVFQGSGGAFVCGESSALVQSMEGRTGGIPKIRPPRLAESGFAVNRLF